MSNPTPQGRLAEEMNRARDNRVRLNSLLDNRVDAVVRRLADEYGVSIGKILDEAWFFLSVGERLGKFTEYLDMRLGTPKDL